MRIEKSKVVEILNGAFQPFTCVAELTNYENGVGLRVYDASGVETLIKWECESVDLQRDKRELASTISELRKRLEAKGVTLDPWSMP